MGRTNDSPYSKGYMLDKYIVPSVQVPNNHILAQNLYYNYYCPKPKYLNVRYMDPLGCIFSLRNPEKSIKVQGRDSGCTVVQGLYIYIYIGLTEKNMEATIS